MNREDIEQWTREAGGFDATPEFLAKFAALVASAEREACAKIAEEESMRGLPDEMPKGKHLKTAIAQIVCGTVIAEAIRNRGQA